MAAFPDALRQIPEYIQNQMDEAMQEVIDSARIQSLGDFLVPVSSENDGLHYVAYARMTLFPSNERSSGGWFKMRAGGAPEGGYTASMLTPYDPGIPAVAFHFAEGRFGAFYCPRKIPRPAIITEVDVDSFTREIGRVYGIQLQGQVHVK